MTFTDHSQKFFVVICILLLSSCGTSTIDIEGTYPTPLVIKLPYTLGVYYDDSFKTHSFTEIDEYSGKEEYVINDGNSQVELFNTILPAAFDEIVILEDINSIADHSELDLVFAPVIEDFQVGLPDKTRLDIYEVWIKYNMRLSETNGDHIADWVVIAYGKSPTATFTSSETGINDAANIALRDLAASFSLGFHEVPGIREWLAQQQSFNEGL